MAVYITVWFLIIKGRWRNFCVSTFYTLTLTLGASKISSLIIEYNNGVEAKDARIFYVSDEIAF